ncbi:ABC transporter ATP-binding protein [bacterium]|nr:ABC transporter ATP-binding protein [bacterium]
MIKISHLRKQFGSLVAVDDLSLEIQKGEIFGFLGPNGAGKTTTIRILCGLLAEDDGEILLNGQSGFLPRVIGVCPQENIYWPRLTCLEQLVFMAKMHSLSTSVAENRAQEILDLLGLTEKKNTLAEKLSGGMKRRLNIALALIHDPEVLVLDEPETGLDPQSRILVRELIKSFAKKKTVILTTHNMDEAERLADRVAIIDRGKLLKLDTVENLKRSIGDGDLLEIKIAVEKNDIDIPSNEALVEALNKTYNRVAFYGDKLQLSSQAAVQKIPEITAALKEYQRVVKGIHLRENTLEDVFIHLTGRGLRE